MSTQLPDRLGAMTALAERNGDPALDRVKNILENERGPTTKASSGQWVNWGSMAEYLGSPFDATSIPLSKLEQMRRDPILSFGMFFIKVPFIRAPWHIECEDPRIGGFIDGALRQIYGSLVLSYFNSLEYGFSPIVKRFALGKADWTYKDVEGNDLPVWDPASPVQPMLWKNFTALNPRKANPAWNANGEFNGIYYDDSPHRNMLGNPTKPPDIPLSHALWATNERESTFNSIYGYPRLGYAYRFWWAYWYRFSMSDRAFERWADPPLKAFHPARVGVDENGNVIDYGNEALRIAELVRSGANVSIPSKALDTMDGRTTSIREWDLEQMESKTDFSALGEVFEYLDVQKLRSVWVPEQALIEGKGGTSSRNVASTFGDFFTESQAVLKQDFDNHLNRWVIPQLKNVNFGESAPKAEIKTTGFDQHDLETMQEVVRLVGQKDASNLPVEINELLRSLGIPVMAKAAFEAKLQREAERARENRAPDTEPEAGFSSGVKDGKYFAPRERIVFNHHTHMEKPDKVELSASPGVTIEQVREVMAEQKMPELHVEVKSPDVVVNVPEPKLKKTSKEIKYADDGVTPTGITEIEEEV